MFTLSISLQTDLDRGQVFIMQIEIEARIDFMKTVLPDVTGKIIKSELASISPRKAYQVTELAKRMNRRCERIPRKLAMA